MANSNSFILQKEYFKQGFDTYFLDLKGFGENREMPYTYSLDDYVKEVLDFINKNNLKKVNVIAHSFGGRIAIKLASIYPSVFNKIVLTGSAGLKPKTSLKKIIKKLVFKVLKLFVKKEKLIKFYSSDYALLSPIMKKSFIKIVNEHLDKNAENIKNETLIINGELDSETPPYMAKRLHKKIKNSKLYFIKGAGHFAFIDRPFEFNREVKEFLLRK